ncbi:fibronectin type III domain-containing protein [Nonlabens sp. Asnod3-A02]|uniref:fibronectin type III domain-containing protein n=1 Tax=Nonlabens sp. Asnod3-A02 TaxID=3160579 RepID=UPI00386A2F56
MKQIYVTVITLFLLTFSFNAQAQCNYTLEVTDFFGNDWVSGNNATANAGVDVTIDGVLTTYRVLNASATGNPVTETYVISVNNMSTIDIDYRAPDLSGDGEFKLIDSEDLLVYQTPIAQVSMMDIFVGSASCPTCPVIVNPGFSGVTANEAIIDWTNGGSETQWEIEYGISPYTPGSGGQVVPASTNPFTITGLSSISTYDVYIRAVCVPGSDVSNPVGPVTFTTTESCPSPSNFSPITQTANNVQFAWDSNGNPSPNYEVNYGPTPFNQGDPSGTTVAGNFGTFAFVDNLMSDTEYAFYVRYDCGMGDFSLWQGPYTATTLISCPAISGIQANTITDSSLDISWSAGGTETEWEVEYALAGTITAPGTGQGTTVSPNPTSPSHLIDALADSSNYDVFIRAVCDPLQPDYSSWVQESFSTLCLPFTSPFNEDFETGFTVRATGTPATTDNFEEENCWSADSPSAYSWVAVATAVTGSGSTGPGVSSGNYFITEASRGTTGDITDLISPVIDLTSLTTPAISFDYHMYGADMGTLEVVVRSGGVDTTVFTLSGQQQTDEDDAFTTVVIPIAAFSSQNIQVIFRSARGTSFTSDMAIDNLLVLESPPCVDPYDLNITALTSSSVDLGWTELGSTTNWDLEIGAAGFVVDSGVATIATSSTTNPYSASGLSPDTLYEFYVRSNCGVDGTSNWVGPFEFRTRCAALTAPYFTDYESDTIDSLNNCDSSLIVSGSTNLLVEVEDFVALSGSNHIYMYSGSDAAADIFYILPEFSDLSSDKRIKFNVYDRDTGGLEVGVMSDPADLTTFTSLVTYTDTDLVDDDYEEKTVYFNSLTTTGGYIAFKFNPAGIFDALYLDDITYELSPSCPEPTQLTTSSVGSSSFDLSWTNNSTASEFLVEYREVGTTVFTAVTPNPTVSNVVVSGLASDADYEVCVTAICDSASNDVSTQSCVNVSTTPDYCAGDLFVDSGGASGQYQGNENIVYNICPDNAGDVVYINFLTNEMEDSGTGCFDGLTIYDGPDTTFPTINTPGGDTEWCWDGTSGTGDLTQELLIGTSTSGCITLVWSTDGSGQRDGWTASVTCAPAPTCPSPDALAVDAFSSTTADLSWTAGAMETEWDIEVGVPGFVPNTGAQTGAVIDVVTSPLTTVTGLTPDTEYEYWVRAVCAPGDESIYIGPLSFRTSCAPFTAPYFTDYDSDPVDGLNNCDRNIVVGSGSGTVPTVEVEDIIANSGSNHIYMYSGSTGATAELYYILPEFSDLDSNKRVRFFAYDRDLGGLEVGTMTDPTDATTFTVHQTFLDADLPDDVYAEQTVDFTSLTTTGGWVAFRFIPNGTFDSMYLDDVNYEVIPSCNQPSAVVTSNLTADSVELSWTAGGSETEWIVEYGTPGFTPGGAGSLGVETGVMTNANYLLDMLPSNTSIELRVFAVCAPGDVSPSTNPIVIRTFPTGPVGVSCPNNDSAFAWEDNFDANNGWTGDVSTSNGDWDFSGTAGTGSTGTGPLGPQEGTGYVFFESSGTNVGANTMVSPAIDLTAATDEAELSFYLHSFGGDLTTLEVGVSTSATGPFTNVFTYIGPLQATQTDAFALVGGFLPASVLGSSTVYIQVSATEEVGNEAGFVGDIAIDLMRIETCGNFCSNPNSMSVTNLTTTGGDFSFVDTAGTPAGAYEYAIQLDGTGVPTAAGTAVATTSFTDSSLMPGTEYEIYYRTICNATASSDWIGPLQFSTNCLPFTAPYFTDYESDPLDGLFVCDNAVFDITTATTTPPEVEVEDLIANSGNQHIYLYNGNDTSAGVYYVMPEFSDLDATKRVRFFAYDRDNSSLEVGVMSDPNDFTTFTVVQTFLDADLPDDVYEEQTVNFSSLTTTGGHIAFRSIQTSTFDAIYLDDINYELIPSCPNPTGVVVNTIGGDSLDLSWSAGLSETEWIVEYATPDFSTGTATAVTGVMTNTNYILNGLTPNTPYEIRVSAVCNPMDISPTTNPLPVRTFPASPQGVSCTTGAPGYVWEDSFDTIATSWTGDVGTGTTGGDWNFGRTTPTGSTGTGPSGPHDGAGYLFFETTGTNVGPASIVSPPIDLTTGANAELELSFFIHSFGGDQTIFDVAYGTSATGPFTSVFSYVGQLQSDISDNYAEVGAMLPSTLIGQTIYIQITGTEEPGEEGGFVGDFAVDLMRIQTCGSFCLAPDGVSVSAITGDSAIVDWTENGNATTWEVAVVASGSGVPTGSGTSVTTNPYSVTALSPSTVYDVYVRADCGGGLFSDWSVVESFSTDCVAFVAPYGTTAGAPGNDFATFPGVCWGEGDNTDVATGPNGLDSDWTNVDFANDPTNVFGQAASINIWNNGGDGDWLVSPEIDLGAAGGSFTASFDVALTEFDDTFASNFGSDDQVQFLITTDGGVTWSIIETFEASDNVSATGQLETFPLNAYSGVVRFGFRATNGTVADNEDIQFFVDNFTVDGTAGVNDVDTFDFTYYPNPTDNIVDFNGQQVIDSLVVRNLLGQQLLVVNPNATSTRIDLSTFPSGMYLIEVISGEQNKTVKVLRN